MAEISEYFTHDISMYPKSGLECNCSVNPVIAVKNNVRTFLKTRDARISGKAERVTC